jgi:hypothetical protein
VLESNWASGPMAFVPRFRFGLSDMLQQGAWWRMRRVCAVGVVTIKVFYSKGGNAQQTELSVIRHAGNLLG